MSILEPTTCGFGKMAVYNVLTEVRLNKEMNESFKELRSRELNKQLELLQNQFRGNENFNFNKKALINNLCKIVSNMRLLAKKERGKGDKQTLLDVFSKKKWIELAPEKKVEHSLFQCDGCLNNCQLKQALGLFVITNPQFKTIAIEKGILVKPNIRKEVDVEIKELVPAVLLEKHDTKIRLAMKTDVEEQFRLTAVETAFGGKQSLRSRNNIRMFRYFENQQDAQERTLRQLEDIREGKRCPKNHIGNLQSYEWRSQDCLDYVNNLYPGSYINFSELAREFGLKDIGNYQSDNKNQVVKKFLQENNVDLDQFIMHRNQQTQHNIRRKKRKLTFDSNVSLPILPSNEQVRRELICQIRDGKYTMGELIVPCIFKKYYVSNDGNLCWKEFAVEGRKNNLYSIRRKLLEDHKHLYRIKNDDEVDMMLKEDVITYLKDIHEYIVEDVDDIEKLKQTLKKFQRQRHLIMWHDGSTISNHGHVLFMVAEVYDKAIHYTDEQVLKNTGKKIDVQSTIEKPEIYILARCPPSSQLTAYSETRMEDLKELCKGLSFRNTEIVDIMRFFKADGPACQFEAGHQKGGHYFCWTCDIHYSHVKDYVYSSYRKIYSYQDRQMKIIKTSGSRRRSKGGSVKLYDKLEKDELTRELVERDVDFDKYTMKELKEQLTKEMHGMQRVPSLLFNNPEGDINSLGLASYEILACEPLHDIMNHIKNLFLEIPHHVKDKSKLKDLIEASFNGKDCQRGVDQRSSLIKVYLFCKNNFPESSVTSILFTLCEIQRVLYLQEGGRTNENILHLYLQTFLHAILIKRNLKITSMTERKFFGKYYHAIVTHACDQYRIVDGRTSNTESEERTFNFAKKISNDTSNHHPDNVISNIFIRAQVRETFIGSSNVIRDEAQISKMYEPIRLKLENSCITFEIIDKYPWEYQALLEKIADFLEDGLFWSEVENGVLFNDITPVDSNKQIHHFRKYTVSDELKYVAICWQNCLKNFDQLIPAFKIKIDDVECISIVYPRTLKHYNNSLITEESIQNNDGNIYGEKTKDIFDESESSLMVTQDNQTGNSVLKPLGYMKLQDTSQTLNMDDSCIIPTPFITSTPNLKAGKIKQIPLDIDFTIDEVEDDKDDDNIQVIIPATINDIHTEIKTDNGYGKTASILVTILGDSELISIFNKSEKKYEMYPHDKDYYEEYNIITAKLEVKLNNKYDNLRGELKQMQNKRLNSNYVSLDLVPTNGIEKDICDNIKAELMHIKLVKKALQL